MPPAKRKAKKTKAPRKPQPLPRSVQALLKYLGGSDVKVGGARGGQPAQLAPTSINIAVSQQQAQQQSQQQAQQQQFLQQRIAQKGQIIAQSPLTSVISQQPIIFGLPQRRSDVEEAERKFQAQAKEAEIKHDEINRKFGLLEASQQQFRQAAAGAYQDIKNDLKRRVTGDANIFDARNLAARFTPRPVVEEPQFAGMSFGQAAAEAQGITVTEVFKGAREEEASTGLAEYLGGQYVENVTNPEMTKIKRSPGRPRKSEAEKAATKTAAAQRRKATTKIPAADVASLLEQSAPSSIASFTPAPVTDPSALFKPTRTISVKKKPTSTAAAPDMATQIALLTGGGAAAAPQSQGQTIAQLLGIPKK